MGEQELLAPVDQATLMRQADLFRLYYAMAFSGLSQESALKLKFISRAKFFEIKSRYPEFVERIAASALADALTTRREELAMVSRRRLAVEVGLIDKLLTAAPDIVDQIIEATKSGNKREVLRAAELAQKWLSKGFAFIHEEGSPDLETKQVALAYNPHRGIEGRRLRPISASLEYEDGTRVEITAASDGDVIEGETT